MQQILRFIFLILLVSNMAPVMPVIAQPLLKPFIGQNAIPGDSTAVCPIPLAIDPGNFFELPGLHAGDTIPDFKLYTIANDSMQIGQLLADGKPVLLIGGNYTCPKYRNHLDELNDLQSTYGSQVHIFVIYTVEAHPADPDISPYKGEVWELNSNINQGIVYHQPVTYLERKNVAAEMLTALDIQVPVLIDGPCNEWWESFALAPNPAFLISPQGTIFKKQGWFDNGQYALTDAIDSLLQNFPTAIAEVAHEVKVINDPAASYIRFVFPEQQQNFHVKLFDMAGSMLLDSQGLSGISYNLEKKFLNTGIYVYSIYTDNMSLTGKVLIQ
jgi:hypothetical protein